MLFGHRTCLIIALVLLALPAFAGPVEDFTKTVSVNGKTFSVTGVRVDLNDPSVSVKLGLAWDHVGRTESLASMARRHGAVAAINGSFFAAYDKDALKNPDMLLIGNGQLVFKSSLGTVLGFHSDNTPVIGRITYRLAGSIRHDNGRTESWHAYWMNRKPTATVCVTVFTRKWGRTVEPMGGASVVVTDGVVTQITTGQASIPNNGYVIHIRNEAKLLARFRMGDDITFVPEMTLEDGSTGNEADWLRVREAVGAGPRVLQNGRPVFNPGAEGFNDPKILHMSAARSAAGFTADRILYLITTRNARVSELGHILKALGCTDGMNLDGGASSGLWYHGKYLTPPGRNISNALLILENPR